MRMAFDIKLEGDKAFIDALNRINKTEPIRVKKIFFAASERTRNEAITSIQRNKPGGRQYIRGNVVHNASPMGGPPNTDTGNLVSNITISEIAGGYDVGSRGGAPYGYHLEFKEPSRGGRPWLYPAFLKGIELAKSIVNRIKNEGPP